MFYASVGSGIGLVVILLPAYTVSNLPYLCIHVISVAVQGVSIIIPYIHVQVVGSCIYVSSYTVDVGACMHVLVRMPMG